MINASSPSSFEGLLSQALEMPEPAQTFSQSLQRQLEHEAARIKFKTKATTPKRLIRRLAIPAVVAVLLFFILSLPPGAFDRVNLWLAHIPGIGLVNGASEDLILQFSANQSKQEVTFTITDALATSERTQLFYEINGLETGTTEHVLNIQTCKEQPWLLLEDGTRLSQKWFGGSLISENVSHGQWGFQPLPAGNYRFTLVVPCIPGTLLGFAPENWQIPVELTPIGSEYNTPTSTAFAIDPTGQPINQATQKPTIEPTKSYEDIAAFLKVETVIATGDGYYLIGDLAEAETGQGPLALPYEGLVKVNDAKGNSVPYRPYQGYYYEILEDISHFKNPWVYGFSAEGVYFPLQLSWSALQLMNNTGEGMIEISIDPGNLPADGGVNTLDSTYELGGYVLELNQIINRGNGTYGVFFGVPAGVVRFDVAAVSGIEQISFPQFLIEQQQPQVYFDITIEGPPATPISISLSHLYTVTAKIPIEGAWQPYAQGYNLAEVEVVDADLKEEYFEVSGKVLPLWEDTLSLAINNIHAINRNNSTIFLEAPSGFSSEADEVDGSVGWIVLLPTRELEFPIELIFEVTLITVDNRTINAIIKLPWIPDGISPLIPWQEQISP